jgi:large repetitive protein
MRSRGRRLLALAGFVALTYRPPPVAAAQSAPELGAAASFAVLGGSAVTNSGPTLIGGNLGASPGKVTGDSVTFTIGDVRNDLAKQAQSDAASAYAALGGQPCRLIGPNLDGLRLEPGVYCVPLSALLTMTSILTLDANGHPDEPWIFRIAGSLTTGTGSSVHVIGGGREANVFWQVAGSATLGTDSAFAGNLLAQSSIALGRGASVSGRLLALTGAVTLDTNRVSLCCGVITLTPPLLPKGAVGADYNTTITASGGTRPYVFTAGPGTLPPRLSLATNGVISGKPTQGGSFSFRVTATDATGCPGHQDYTIEIDCPAITIAPDPPITAMACVELKPQFAASPPGSYTYVFTADDPGLGLPSPSTNSTGLLDWTPEVPGDYTLNVSATDAAKCSGSRDYLIHVLCPTTPLPPVTLPEAPLCALYSQTLYPIGCTTAEDIRIIGTLPPGLSLAGRLISGTPRACGTYEFDATGVSRPSGCVVTRHYRIAVTCPFEPPLPDGKVCMPYCVTLPTFACSSIPYDFVLLSGQLPPDVTLASGGLLCGTPKEPGVYRFIVRATNPEGSPKSVSYILTIAPTIIVLPASGLPGATVSVPYTAQIRATGGSGSYTFTASPGLPPGLIFYPNSGAFGVITGPPTMSGPYRFTVTATDTVTMCLGRQDYVIVIAPGCAIQLPPSLPPAPFNSPYSATVTASGGTAPYTFALSSGALPPGLTLNPMTGVISGTATAMSGLFDFCVTVTDANGVSCTQCYTIPIIVPAPTLSGWSMLICSLLLTAAAFAFMKRAGG